VCGNVLHVPAEIERLYREHRSGLIRLVERELHDRDDAEDVVQEAYLRAVQYSGGFRGGDTRAWVLTIVRDTAYRWLGRKRTNEPVAQFDETVHTGASSFNPEQLLVQIANADLVEKTLTDLPVRFREILVLRELEGLSYKEIADIMGVPTGTVMSTLSRARQRFRQALDRLRNNFASDRVSITESTADVVRGRT
jgi:RNA polymerase sigma-70 factor, ECF subfamily